MSTKFIDLTNKVFGNWTVIKRGEDDSSGKIRWLCKCSCGVKILVCRSSLRNGRSTGCKSCSKRNNRHGLSRSSTYKVWDSAVQRCTNPKAQHFHNYGGRGITMCHTWVENFMNFFNDMGEKPKHLTLDRIDNDKGYFKENCRWTTMKVQNRNRRHCVKIGGIYHGWRLIKRFPNPHKSMFQCIHCFHLIIYCTSSVKTGGKHCYCHPLPLLLSYTPLIRS